ncbi:MAG: hypothetical protein IPF53_16265 [Blastocatellia bacterium]|jgi:hypothetical protein|nr:hypothetical protein [Blastocatellia bacterium]
MSDRTEELYVGYLVPSAVVVGRLRRIAAVAFVLAAATAMAASFGHRPLPASAFEFGTTRTFEGVVRESPAPMLLVAADPNRSGPVSSACLLVAPGKHGAGEFVRGLDGDRVRVSGTLVYRDGQTMVEVEPESMVPLGKAAFDPPATVDLGSVTLSGEIVDSKCYLGVMNPGESKTHRDCAVRCISGGAPPLFVASDEAGNRMQMLLVGDDGGAIHRDVLPWVAEPVEITGRLVSMGDLFVLHANPTRFRRLS